MWTIDALKSKSQNKKLSTSTQNLDSQPQLRYVGKQAASQAVHGHEGRYIPNSLSGSTTGISDIAHPHSVILKAEHGGHLVSPSF